MPLPELQTFNPELLTPGPHRLSLHSGYTFWGWLLEKGTTTRSAPPPPPPQKKKKKKQKGTAGLPKKGKRVPLRYQEGQTATTNSALCGRITVEQEGEAKGLSDDQPNARLGRAWVLLLNHKP